MTERAPALVANCLCMHCCDKVSAQRWGDSIVLLEIYTSADGEFTNVGDDYLRIVDNKVPRGSRFTIEARLVGVRMRFREHERHCKKRIVSTEAMQKTRPTGVWNRDR